MASFPCPVRSDCAGSDSPFENLTSELPDTQTFNGWFDGLPWIVPPLGSNWTVNTCLGQCVSSISQADADACAQIASTMCAGGTWGPPGVRDNGGPSSGPPIVPPPFNPLPVFLNTPQECTIFCPDGLPFTYRVAAGLFATFNQATANLMASSYACQLATINAVCLSTLSAKACNGTPYSDSITPSRPASYTYVLVAGALPPGLSLSPGPSPTGTVSGTPTATGSYSFTIRVTNPVGNFMQKTYVINVLGIDQTGLPDASTSSPYNETLTASGGTAPFVFSIELGDLPTGLSLAPSGLISGTATENGDFSVTFGVTDSGSNFCTKTLSLHVGGSCVDWTQMKWGQSFGGAVIITQGDGVATFTPNNTASDVFNFHVSATAPSNGVNGAACENDAQMTYAGPACNAKVHIDVSAFQAVACAGLVNLNSSIVVRRDSAVGPVLVQFDICSGGVFDAPFAVPDGTGTPVVLYVFAFAQTNSQAVGNVVLTVQAQLINT